MSTGQNFQRLGYRRIVQLLIYLVIIPTVLLLTLGFVLMFIGEGSINLLLGILTVTFVSVVVTGVILVLVFVRREANLSELQADFVSKVSHELRTPLTAIRLFAETIERSREDERTVDQCLDLLLGECERLTGRIERLLDWGRMEAGRRLYHLREQSVTEVFEHAVSAFSALRTDKIDFESELEPDLPKIHADRDALVDAVVNLLSNAHKYGGTPPVVRLRAYAPATGGVAISVTDNGPGIARPEHRRIFQKFYRIDDRLSREREGSGLGLAIVKHVVRAHRGRIVLESEPGKGSTFTLVLPTPRRSRKKKTSGAHPAAEVSG
ncbi:ATP-binding protein [Pendulispora brunnea]|uniref:histidine kinase n=1 Tax=Pendulispora brunnea TaxID=2905690 RepID=A0ABZ2KD81_9BACT